MASSGVEPTDACITTFQQFKLKRKLRYIVFTINDSRSEIVVDRTCENDRDTGSAAVASGPQATYEAFVDTLPKDACRWAVYDFEFDKDDGKRDKLCFISWSPDNATIKDKMLHASSHEALKRKLVGASFEMQGTDPSEINYQSVLAKALAFTH